MKNLLFISIINLLICFAGNNSIVSQDLENEAQFKAHKSIPGYGRLKKKNAEVFQGNKKKKNYFEGWYFKMVSDDGSSIISVIPGISLSETGEEQHAFIQIIDGKTATTFYYTFPIEDFAFSKKKFAVRIGKNYFSEDSLVLNIKNDTSSINGTVYISNPVKLTKNNKGKKKLDIMGWYKRVPFMQCYHGIVSLNHNLTGTLKNGNEIFNFDNGIGYIEKDWGTSMPSSWIWIQSNSFSSSKTSFMLSLADVPWVGKSFPGFLGFFLNDSIVHRFGTYSNAKLQLDNSDSDTIKIIISDNGFTYQIETYRDQAGILIAPVKGSMDRRIAESVDAELKLTVLDKKGNIIFEDRTSITGLEIVGDMDELTKKGKKKKSKTPD